MPSLFEADYGDDATICIRPIRLVLYTIEGTIVSHRAFVWNYLVYFSNISLMCHNAGQRSVCFLSVSFAVWSDLKGSLKVHLRINSVANSKIFYPLPCAH